MELVVKGLVREVWLVGCVLRCLVCGRDEAELRRTDEDEVDRSLQGRARSEPAPPPAKAMYGTCLQGSQWRVAGTTIHFLTLLNQLFNFMFSSSNLCNLEILQFTVSEILLS